MGRIPIILKDILHGFHQAQYKYVGVVFDIPLTAHFVNHLNFNFFINNLLLIIIRFHILFSLDTETLLLPTINGKRHASCYIPVLSPSSIEVPKSVSIS
jgi:hypothetical protein